MPAAIVRQSPFIRHPWPARANARLASFADPTDDTPSASAEEFGRVFRPNGGPPILVPIFGMFAARGEALRRAVSPLEWTLLLSIEERRNARCAAPAAKPATRPPHEPPHFLTTLALSDHPPPPRGRRGSDEANNNATPRRRSVRRVAAALRPATRAPPRPMHSSSQRTHNPARTEHIPTHPFTDAPSCAGDARTAHLLLRPRSKAAPRKMKTSKAASAAPALMPAPARRATLARERPMMRVRPLLLLGACHPGASQACAFASMLNTRCTTRMSKRSA